MQVIAELESSPWIDSIGTLRMTRLAGPRKIRVDLTVEALIVSAERRGRVMARDFAATSATTSDNSAISAAPTGG